MSTWDFARRSFDEQFRPLVTAGYELERVNDPSTYWDLHEAELRAHFPPEVFFDLSAARTQAERDGQTRLGQARAAAPLRDFTVVRKAGRLAALFSGEQKTDNLYRMWHSNVHPDYRRQGLYRMILQCTIRYTEVLGFDSIGSEHAFCNNAVIIAKLRAGFNIYAFEMDPGAGPSLVLRYFHNPEHRAAYQLRCGWAALTPGLAAAGTGHWTRFREQVLASPAPENQTTR